MSSQDDRDVESSTQSSWAEGLEKRVTEDKQETRSKTVFSGFDIDKYAKLANLTLTDEEKDLYSEQLLRIIGYCVERLNQIPANNIDPIFNVTGQSNVMCEDETIPSLSQKDALSNASKKKDGLFETKGVFEGE